MFKMRIFISKLHNSFQINRYNVDLQQMLCSMKRKFYYLSRMQKMLLLLIYMNFISCYVKVQTVFYVSNTGDDNDDRFSWLTPNKIFIQPLTLQLLDGMKKRIRSHAYSSCYTNRKKSSLPHDLVSCVGEA